MVFEVGVLRFCCSFLSVCSLLAFFLLGLWKIYRQKTPLTFLPTHSEGVNKRKQESWPSLATSLPLGVSVVFPPPPVGRLSVCKFNFPLRTQTPLRTNKTLSQWDFSRPIWVTWNLSLVFLDIVLLTYAILKGAFSATALKPCSSSVVPFSARQTDKPKWAFSFDTMRGSDLTWVKASLPQCLTNGGFSWWLLYYIS